MYIYIYMIYVKKLTYRPHLAKTINLRQFRMENDSKNGAVLTIILPARFEKITFFLEFICFSNRAGSMIVRTAPFLRSFSMRNCLKLIVFAKCGR